MRLKLDQNVFLVMITVDGNFYPINAVADVPLEQQAADHGLLNDHITRIEDLSGNVLWTRGPLQ